jgi:hypothetical protein
MRRLIRGLVGTTTGAVLGGVLGFYLPGFYYQLVAPKAFDEGGLGMLALVGVGATWGVVLGASLGLVIALRKK